jgi:hypothetical protein
MLTFLRAFFMLCNHFAISSPAVLINLPWGLRIEPRSIAEDVSPIATGVAPPVTWRAAGP